MRVIACFMVIIVHATEPLYLGGEGSQILTKADAFWSSFFDSFVREWLGIGLDGRLGIWTTPVEIIISGVSGFVCSTIVAVVLQKIPKVGKYIAG